MVINIDLNQLMEKHEDIFMVLMFRSENKNPAEVLLSFVIQNIFIAYQHPLKNKNYLKNVFWSIQQALFAFTLCFQKLFSDFL